MNGMRFEVLTVVKFEITVLCDVPSCMLAAVYNSARLTSQTFTILILNTCMAVNTPATKVLSLQAGVQDELVFLKAIFRENQIH